MTTQGKNHLFSVLFAGGSIGVLLAFVLYGILGEWAALAGAASAALIAYLGYKPREVAHTFARAFTITFTEITPRASKHTLRLARNISYGVYLIIKFVVVTPQLWYFTGIFFLGYIIGKESVSAYEEPEMFKTLLGLMCGSVSLLLNLLLATEAENLLPIDERVAGFFLPVITATSDYPGQYIRTQTALCSFLLDKKVSYSFFLRWFLPVTLVIWLSVPYGILLILFWGVKSSLKASWLAFRWIHSDMRVMCAVDGGSGMILAWGLARVYFGSEFGHLSPLVQLAVAFCGGVSAIAIGYINYKLIARHVLNIVPTE